MLAYTLPTSFSHIAVVVDARHTATPVCCGVLLPTTTHNRAYGLNHFGKDGVDGTLYMGG